MIHVVVALAAEARPLIARWRLRSLAPRAGYRVFEGDGVRVVVSGAGKVAAAAATAHLASLAPEAPARGWINAGVAAHASVALGAAVLAHRIEDASSGKRFYPMPVFPVPCPTADLVTVDRPVERAAGAAAYDMEGSGFFEAASRSDSAELIHCLKVVSDRGTGGEARPFEAARVESLMASALDLIDALRSAIEELVAQSASIGADPPGYAEVVERCRLSRTQAHRVRDLLRRRRALALPFSSDDLAAADIDGPRGGARAIIAHLESQLRRLEAID
jgi:nucleoside phosphorylase